MNNDRPSLMKNEITLEAKKSLRHRNYSLLLLIGILLAMVIVLTASSEFFLTLKNIKNILNQTSTYLILSLGMTLVICTGGIDLSVGAVLAGTGILMGTLIHLGLPVWLAIMLGLMAGTLVGAINGMLVAKLKVNALIVTLCTTSIIRGVILVATNTKSVHNFPESFTFWGSPHSIFSLFSSSLDVPVLNIINPPIAISLLLTLIFGILLSRCRLGHYCLCLGSNEKALFECGVKTNRWKVLIYALCGLTAAIAGFVVTARLNSAEVLAGDGYEMDAIAAVVLGGTSIQGGRGSISGTFIACLIIAVMRNGLTVLSVNTNYQRILTGIIVLVAVIVAETRRRRGKEV